MRQREATDIHCASPRRAVTRGLRWLHRTPLFQPAHALHQRTLAATPRRPGQRKHFPPQRRLLFSVVAAMPRLEVDLRGLPKSLHQGEVAACTAVLRNMGTLPLRNLQLVLSGPEVGHGASGGLLVGTVASASGLQ